MSFGLPRQFLTPLSVLWRTPLGIEIRQSLKSFHTPNSRDLQHPARLKHLNLHKPTSREMVLEAIKSNVLKTGCLHDTFTDDGITNPIYRAAPSCFEFKLVESTVLSV
jgi:hypothetical protein